MTKTVYRTFKPINKLGKLINLHLNENKRININTQDYLQGVI